MTKKITVALCIILILCLITVFLPVSNGVYTDPEEIEISEMQQALCFNAEGEFTILHLTDLHELIPISAMHDESIRRTELYPLNAEYINNTIDAVNPDLVVLGGDNIFPLSTIGEILEQETLKTIEALCSLFNAKQQYWTMIFGNHDDECIFDKTQQLLHAAENSGYFIGGLTDGDCYYGFADTENDMVGNYAIPIYDTTRTSILYNIFTFDSGSARELGENNLDGYNYIRKPQIDWYRQTSDLIAVSNGGVRAPAIAFTHIPLYEHREAYYNRGDSETVKSYTGVYGGYSLSKTRSLIFDEFCEIGDVKAVFTGHNHDTSFTAAVYKPDGGTILLSTTRQCAVWESDGIVYNNPPYSRIITLKADGGLTTSEYQTEAFNTISV